MALTQEDLAALGSFIDQRVSEAVAKGAPEQPPMSTAQLQADRESKVGRAEVPFDAGPLYYLHLSNGDVVTSHDSSSTHMGADDGSTQQVIGRYQVPPDALNEDGTLKDTTLRDGAEREGAAAK
jgi:hypothetical protein